MPTTLKQGLLYLFIGFLLNLSLPIFGQSFQITRVDPPFWWTEMEVSSLELLVYGKNIAGSQVVIENKGISLQGVIQVENPNYLFLDLQLEQDVEPGVFSILVSKNGVSTTIRYELKERERKSNRIQGVGTEDLIYLLMPDRFSDGDPSNNQVPGMHQANASRSGQYQRHGGDIQGVMNHLDYFKKLGVTALWLNPVEENNQHKESYHGYAITDHYRVDPRLGSNELYVDFVEACHKKEIKVIRDVIYNHVGLEHWFIKDLPSRDWIHQFDSFTKTSYRAPTLLDPYASDYDRKIMSNGWFDHHMPDLNQHNEHLATYLIQNSVWWIEYAGLDGYRIDTYAYPDQVFMGRLAKRIRLEYPEISIFGETWVHGNPVQAWFTENTHNKEFNSYLPGITDFQLNYAIYDALNQPFGWTEGVSRLYYTLAKDYVYHDPNQNVVFLDNHDIGRYYSGIGEDFQKYQMGIGFLLTTRGIPQLYYGTEILMKNHFDHNNHDKVREEFPGGWNGDEINKFLAAGRSQQEQEAFEFVSTLANYRKSSTALTEGKLMQFVPEEGVYVFFRYNEAQTIMVIMNQNSKEMPLSMEKYQERTSGFQKGTNILTKESLDLSTLSSPPMSILILELN